MISPQIVQVAATAMRVASLGLTTVPQMSSLREMTSVLTLISFKYILPIAAAREVMRSKANAPFSRQPRG